MSDFTMQQRYRLVYDDQINLEHLVALTKVYLPIIGRDAFTLYTFWGLHGETSEASLQHVDLLDQLAMGQHEFIVAREKLEGMGLVKTYKQEMSYGVQWVYQLFPTMSIQHFLTDGMLSSLLAHYLGDALFNELVARETAQRPDIAGTNVSKSFFDMIGNESFQKLPQAPLSVQEQKTPLQIAVNQSDKQVNISLLTDMLRSFNVAQTELVKHKEALTIQKALYGLSDLELVRAIQASLTPNHEINIAALQKYLRQSYQQSQRKAIVPDSDITPVTSAVPITADNPAEQLLHTAKQLAPLVFLKNLREQTGGFVTDAEINTLNDLVQLDKVSNEVLNVILYELTTIEKKTTLSKALLQTIVNDWAQAGVTNAIEGLTYLQKRSQNRQRRQTSGNSRQKWSQKKPVVKEQRPDWENQKATKVSTADATAATNKLAEIRASRRNTEGAANNGE